MFTAQMVAGQTVRVWPEKWRVLCSRPSLGRNMEAVLVAGG